MALKYILSQAGNKLGLSSSEPDQRTTLVRYANEAAKAVYDENDAVGSVMEMVFKINGDQTITMPYYVGPIRGLRECASMQVWHINKMRPRYNQYNWQDMWRNVRLRNKQALQKTLTNQGILRVVVPIIEDSPVSVTIVGPNDLASNYTETLLMDSESIALPNGGGFYKETTNPFNDVSYLAKDKINDYDVILQDPDEVEISRIPNCRLEAEYQVYDISMAPWLSQTVSNVDNYVEVIYKQALSWLYKDTDLFPASSDYDDIIVDKMIQIYKEEQEKVDVAVAYDGKVTRALVRKEQMQNGATEDCIAFVGNPHDTINRRIGSSLRRRNSSWSGRRIP
jgi:hypothetical protein